MRVACPSCHALLELDVLLQHEAARVAVARLASVSLPFGALTMQYLALFRPEHRGLSMDRVARLIMELVPDIERRTITRNGREWDADVEAWRAALRVVLDKRDKGALRLPLTSHGLLYEVIAGLADKHEARAEAQNEQQRRQERRAGAQAGPRDLYSLAETIGADVQRAANAAPTAPPPNYSKPSRLAQQIREHNAQYQQRRQQGSAAEEPKTETP
jgi:hypothetical protein